MPNIVNTSQILAYIDNNEGLCKNRTDINSYLKDLNDRGTYDPNDSLDWFTVLINMALDSMPFTMPDHEIDKAAKEFRDAFETEQRIMIMKQYSQDEAIHRVKIKRALRKQDYIFQNDAPTKHLEAMIRYMGRGMM